MVFRPSVSLTVIGTDMYRSAAYDFLVTFHSNLSCTVAEINAISVENRKFSPPRVFFAPAKWVPIGIGCRCVGPRKKFDNIFSRLDTIYERDGRTDGRTDARRQQILRLRIASRGKKHIQSKHLQAGRQTTCGDSGS